MLWEQIQWNEEGNEIIFYEEKLEALSDKHRVEINCASSKIKEKNEIITECNYSLFFVKFSIKTIINESIFYFRYRKWRWIE